jgi:ketosteroid isomerase-like protein
MGTDTTNETSTRKTRALRPRMRCLAGIMVGSLLAVGALSPRSAAVSAPRFRTTLDAHLGAIAARDFQALLPTLTTGEALTMLAPNGYKFDTRTQYVDFHRTWFAAKDEGKLEFEIVRVIESPALAHALLKYRYRAKDPHGKAQTTVAWLALTFALENGAWRLVFDQNTPITAAP